MPRPTWQEFAIRLAETAAERSEDPHQKVGCCVLRHDHSVAAIGYNGAPPGISIDWSNRDERRPKVLHAEVNALRYVRPGEGWLLAVTLSPCRPCITLIAAQGIREVVYRTPYEEDDAAFQLAKEYGIRVTRI